jgi:2-phospho-L-lactate guanylyltransferase
MAEDVIAALLAVPLPPQCVMLVSEDADVASLAQRRGVCVFCPPPATGDPLNAALEAAERAAMASGAGAVLMIHADLPAVNAAALRGLLAAHASAVAATATAVATLVCDGAGTGTNCLVLSPPLSMALRFGPASRALHREAAAAAGVDYREFMHPSLDFDVDFPADLDRLVRPGETQDNALGAYTRAWVLDQSARHS